MDTENWRRPQWFDETGLPWVNPSPNLRSLAALTSYPGTVYFEGTNLTEGRGNDRPFEQIGAPWLDAQEVARVMNERRLPGIRFEAITMTVAPTAAKHKGQTIPAIGFAVTDRLAYRPVRTSLLVIDDVRRRHPRDFAWTGTIDRLAGSDRVRLAVEGAGSMPCSKSGIARFRESRKDFPHAWHSLSQINFRNATLPSRKRPRRPFRELGLRASPRSDARAISRRLRGVKTRSRRPAVWGGYILASVGGRSDEAVVRRPRRLPSRPPPSEPHSCAARR